MENTSRVILITSDSPVKSIQNTFNLFYPFLHIEFATSSKGVFSFKKHQLTEETIIGKVVNVAEDIILNIEEERTIAEIEKDFNDLLKLCIQVFRKSGNVWNEISLTDSWTLKSQNKAGEFISSEMAVAS